jgi:hypothetical protein
MRNSTHEDEVTRVPWQEEQGWIWTSRGRKELRRNILLECDLLARSIPDSLAGYEEDS